MQNEQAGRGGRRRAAAQPAEPRRAARPASAGDADGAAARTGSPRSSRCCSRTPRSRPVAIGVAPRARRRRARAALARVVPPGAGAAPPDAASCRGPDVGVDYASELFIAGEARQATAGHRADHDREPGRSERVAAQAHPRAARGRTRSCRQQTLQRANVALTNRMATLAKAAGNTTRPPARSISPAKSRCPIRCRTSSRSARNKPELLDAVRRRSRAGWRG